MTQSFLTQFSFASILPLMQSRSYCFQFHLNVFISFFTHTTNPIHNLNLGAMTTFTGTITITLSECAENHVGMQQVGQRLAEGSGLSFNDLFLVEQNAIELGYETEWHALGFNLPVDMRADEYDAYFLVIRNGLQMLMGEKYQQLIDEIKSVGPLCDKKMYNKGKVVNKNARFNTTFAEERQDPDYENKKGTTLAFKDFRCIQELVKERIVELLSTNANCANLNAEVNYYFDPSNCGIGFHGDAERRIVIGMRVGATMDLHFQWFFQGQPIGEREICTLHEGDLYFISEKAVGTDWHRRNIPTLRHAAGCTKYTTIKGQQLTGKRPSVERAARPSTVAKRVKLGEEECNE